MTRKPPLEVVMSALASAKYAINGREHTGFIDDAIKELSGYMGQTGYCAECERLTRENKALREAISVVFTDEDGDLDFIQWKIKRDLGEDTVKSIIAKCDGGSK